MKFSIFLFFLFFKITQAATVPKSWFLEGQTNKNNSKEVEAFQLELGQIFNAQLNTLDRLESEKQNMLFRSAKGFKFSHYVTDFSISRGGLFGFSSLKASHAVEVKWRKKSAKETVQTKVVSFSKANDKDFSLLTQKIINIAKSDPKITNHENLEFNIKSSMDNFKYFIQSSQNKDFENWALAGIRVDLNIAASGAILWGAGVGADLRIRLEWKNIEKREERASNKKTIIISNISNMLLYDLDLLLKEKQIEGFKIDKVNVGVGISHKGRFFGLARGKTAFVGYLRFKPVKRSRFKTNGELSETIANEEIPLIDADSEGANKGFGFHRISRRKFRRGLQKSFGMVSSFAKAANQRQGAYWEASGLKAVFDLQKTGFLGLSTTTGKNVIEIELKR